MQSGAIFNTMVPQTDEDNSMETILIIKYRTEPNSIDVSKAYNYFCLT